ncbi:MAG TPA: trehalose-phosphatase [Myxococcota bacterium]|nr:trehalose-phosphatase [Myxococcota bacterium]
MLEQFSWSNAVLAFDYDGTLAPIVADPARAEMRGRTRELLDVLTGLYPVLVISGRAQDDVRRLLRGVPVDQIVGNHGVEPSHGSPRLAAEVRRWLPVLERRFADLKGVTIEQKVFSLAVHYRSSREKKKARVAIARTAAELGEVRVIGGKQVVNLLPLAAPHKGIALERERDRLRCDTAIFVGDDKTDEDVFALDRPGRLLGIRVGRSRASAAAYYIPGQRAIDALLKALVDLRRESLRARGVAR